MADAMQGIMSLPPEMGGMETAPRSFLTPEDENTLNQLRSSVSSQEFSSEMFNAAEQADPQSVMQLRMMLQGLQLPPELIDLLRQMVDKLLAEPDNYQENRQKFLAEGVPEDLLPPDFDPSFFVALNMALDQVSGTPVQGFAGGGMAMNPIAGGIAGLGRYGDTMLAHITPQEAMMLRRQGGAGSINPATGLPEFFNLFKSIGNAFKRAGGAIVGAVKDVGRAIKGFVKSDIGRMITTVAIAYFLGPLAAPYLGVSSVGGIAAVGGFLGGAGSTLLAGGSFKDALKNGAIGGVVSGIGAFATQGGTAAFQTPYGGPTTISGLTKQAISALTPTAPVGLSDEAAQALMAGDDVVTGGASRLAPRGSGYTNVSAGDQAVAAADDAIYARSKMMTGPKLQTTTGMTGADLRAAQDLAAGQARRTIGQYQMPTNVGAGSPVAVAPPADVGTLYGFKAPGAVTGPRLDAMATSAGNVAAAPPPSQGIMDLIGKGEFTQAGKQALQGTKDIYNQYLSPAGLQQQGAEAARRAGMEAYEEALRLSGDKLYAAQVAKEAAAAALPSTLSSYLPLAAAGTGAAYLGGAFDVPEPPKPKIPISGEELFKRNPYLITPRVRTVSASTGQPYRYAAGGIADLAGGTSKYPRKNGPIDGPGTGTSDSIPAMLSDGEFVFTAKAVRAMGKGSRRKGAKRMYALMKALEKRT